MWNNKPGRLARGAAAAQGVAAHRLAGSEQLHCVPPVLYILFLIVVACFPSFFFPSFLLNCPYLNQHVLALFLSIFSPSHCKGSEQTAVWWLAVCRLNHDSTSLQNNLG